MCFAKASYSGFEELDTFDQSMHFLKMKPMIVTCSPAVELQKHIIFLIQNLLSAFSNQVSPSSSSTFSHELGHKYMLVLARLEKQKNPSQFESPGLRCVAMRALVAFHLNGIRQYQHFLQAETLQRKSCFLFHFLNYLNKLTSKDALSPFESALI